MANRSQVQKDIKKTRNTGIAVMFVLFVLCAIVLFSITITAKASELQYEINTLSKEIQETERRIQTLEVKIKSASNITTVEKRALELGLTHPGVDDIVHLSDSDSMDEFALALMESVY